MCDSCCITNCCCLHHTLFLLYPIPFYEYARICLSCSSVDGHSGHFQLGYFMNKGSEHSCIGLLIDIGSRLSRRLTHGSGRASHLFSNVYTFLKLWPLWMG